MANWRPLTFKNRAQAQIPTCDPSEPTKVRKLFFVLTSSHVRRRGPNGFSALVEVVWTFMKFKICLYFWGVFGPWRGSVASYTTDERAKNGQKERWRLNLEELKLKIKSSSEKFRRLHCCRTKPTCKFQIIKPYLPYCQERTVTKQNERLNDLKITRRLYPL